LFYYYALVGERSFSAVPSDSTVRKKWKKRQESSVKNTSDRNFES